MTNSNWISSPARTEAEKSFCSAVKDLAKIICAPPNQRLNADDFARHALKALRAGWIATAEWTADATESA